MADLERDATTCASAVGIALQSPSDQSQGTPSPNNPSAKSGVFIAAKKASTAVWLEAGWALRLEGGWLAESIGGEEVPEDAGEESVLLIVPVGPCERGPGGM